MSAAPDEFDWIASLRPLSRGDPSALSLMDDAAILPARPGFDLVISADAMVEGVHFIAGEAPQIVAKRLLRTALSDLAAKAASPFGYLLMTAWPADRDAAWRQAFKEGLAEDGAFFAVNLLGGDTVATSGPLTLSATVLGWAPAGAAVLRSGARPGDALIVCGAIGDGWLGLRAARGEIVDPGGRLAGRYRLPVPLFGLSEALRAYARAAADVSDGLLADAEHIAEASGLGVRLDLAGMPLSAEGRVWLDAQPDRAAAILALAAGGDDYALVCAVDPGREAAFRAAVQAAGALVASVGAFESGSDFEVSLGGVPVSADRRGWRH